MGQKAVGPLDGNHSNQGGRSHGRVAMVTTQMGLTRAREALPGCHDDNSADLALICSCRQGSRLIMDILEL